MLQHMGFSLRWILLWNTGSRHADSVVVAHGLSCSTTCGIFPDQGSNPYPRIGRWTLIHCTAGEVQRCVFKGRLLATVGGDGFGLGDPSPICSWSPCWSWRGRRMVIQRPRESLRQQSTPPGTCASKYRGFGRAVAEAVRSDGLPWPPGPCLSKQGVQLGRA